MAEAKKPTQIELLTEIRDLLSGDYIAPPRGTCRDCEHWMGDRSGKKKGYCLRYPPVQSAWTQSHPDSGCGEWRLNPLAQLIEPDEDDELEQ